MNRVIAKCRPVGWPQRLLGLLVLLQLILLAPAAQALPSFARQTGQRCASCHAGGQFPELTTFGRIFKLSGYALGNRTVPLSVMGVVSDTKTRTPTDDAAFAKDAVALFQTGSVFVAGKITDNAGLFAQFTYNNYDHRDATNTWQGNWASDNFDLRVADNLTIHDHGLIAGLSLNNNPSLADPWNTAPAWMQYVPTSFGVTGPDAAPIISQLGQQAAGLSAYAWWNQTVYAEVAAYRTANGPFSFLSQGIANADQTKLRGTSPYLRLALSHDWGPHSAMIGMLAMNADVYPDNLNEAGPTTHYRDRGIDAQYQYAADPYTVTAQLSYIHETIGNGDMSGIASNPSDRLNQWKAKLSAIYRNRFGASLGYFNTSGDSDATLYPDPAANPGTSAWVPEVFWTPVQNARIGAQYYAFTRYHGATDNYDGAGRNARDNNTLFLYAWFAY